MKAFFRDTRFWVRNIEKQYVLGILFGVAWCALMKYGMSLNGGSFLDLFEEFVLLLLMIYAHKDVGMLRVYNAQTVISLNGTRKGIILGTFVADLLFCVQVVGTFAVIELFRENGNLTANIFLYLWVFLFFQGIGYFQGPLWRRFGGSVANAVRVFEAILFGGMFAFFASIDVNNQQAWISWPTNINILFLVLAVALNVAGKLMLCRVIKKMAVVC